MIGNVSLKTANHSEPLDGLFNLIKAAPASLKHEPGVILAEGDYVIVHGRFLPERNKQFTKRCSDKSLYPGRYRCNLTRQPYRNCLYKRFTGLTELAGSNFRRCCKVGFSVTSPCRTDQAGASYLKSRFTIHIQKADRTENSSVPVSSATIKAAPGGYCASSPISHRYFPSCFNGIRAKL
jgi:hypothetical protein